MSTPANPDDLLAFVRACYDERERTAREGIPFGAGRWQAEDSGLIRDSEGGCVVHDDGEQDRATAEHIADNDPAYVLADLDAKRRILDLHGHDGGGWDGEGKRCNECGGYDVVPGYGWKGYRRLWPCQTLKLLALPFADREGFREEWRPA